MADPAPISKSTYETGMRITFEPRSGSVFVWFRGRLAVLPGAFDTEDEALAAGETYCARLGWRPGPPRHVPRVQLRSAW